MSGELQPVLQDLPLGGPYFDDLHVGLRVDSAPAFTLGPGHAAVHQAILGDRLRLALDATLTEAVLDTRGLMAHPALVWDVAIGQSTLLTQRVKANLFYRGLAFRRAPLIGDTLHTVTEVVAMRHNSLKPGRPATGMAVLRIRTVDQLQRPVLDFLRCAMLPVSAGGPQTGYDDEIDSLQPDTDGMTPVAEAIAAWDLEPFAATARVRFGHISRGASWTIGAGDVVSSAPELARLTLNIASTHHDRRPAGRRLVYGGHTIGIAAAQVTRVLPDLVTIVAWRSCDHIAPVYEGDTLYSQVTVEHTEPLRTGPGGLAHLRTRVFATRAAEEQSAEVLDWRFVAMLP